MAQMVKNLLSIQETQFQLLGREDSLEKGMAWRIPLIEEPGELQSMWLQRVGQDLVSNIYTINKTNKQTNKEPTYHIATNEM